VTLCLFCPVRYRCNREPPRSPVAVRQATMVCVVLSCQPKHNPLLMNAVLALGADKPRGTAARRIAQERRGAS
jgi:hypothetical protein